MRKVLMGNHALSEGAVLSRVQVIAAYPITPQTQVVELLSEKCADGTLNAKFVKVESEHSAMAACIGASAAGARAFTATSAQGLALMHEVLHWAVGARLPIVMGNINRAMAPPWTIWTDQTDSLAQRDTGWMQVYCQNNQEVLDAVILSYKVSEQVLLPTMIVLDAFFLSHTYEVVEMPLQDKVDKYLPPYNNPYRMDVDDPHTFGGLTGPDWYFELRYNIEQAMEEAKDVWKKEGALYGEYFGRKYDLVDAYRCEDAEVIFVAVATVASTARVVVDEMRKEGKKVGLLRLFVFRPFPYEDVRSALGNAKKVVVMDRNISFGAGGIFYQEVKSAMYGMKNEPVIFGIVSGLGGRDITPSHIREMIEYAYKHDEPEKDIIWMGVKV